MQVTIENINSCQKKLKITLASEVVRREIDLLYHKLNKRVKIPGFRAGKTPRSILEKKYAQEVEIDLLNNLVPQFSHAAAKENGLRIINDIVLKDYQIDKDKVLTYTVIIEIFPEIKLKDYQGLKFIKKIREIQQEDIDAELKFLQETYSEYESKEKGGVEKTDYIIIDYELFNEGKCEKEENKVIILGLNSLPLQIERELIGLEKGEEKEIKTEIEGKEVKFKVKVKEIKEKRLKELNDDFAREVGNYAALAELREEIRKDLEEKEDLHAERVLEEEIINKLIELNPLEIPPSLIAASLDLDLKGKKENELTEAEREIRNWAIKKLQGYLLLEKISELNHLEISEQELDEKIKKYALEERMDFVLYKKKMQAKGDLDALRRKLKNIKVLNYLKSRVQIEQEINK